MVNASFIVMTTDTRKLYIYITNIINYVSMVLLRSI